MHLRGENNSFPRYTTKQATASLQAEQCHTEQHLCVIWRINSKKQQPQKQDTTQWTCQHCQWKSSPGSGWNPVSTTAIPALNANSTCSPAFRSSAGTAKSCRRHREQEQPKVLARSQVRWDLLPGNVPSWARWLQSSRCPRRPLLPALTTEHQHSNQQLISSTPNIYLLQIQLLPPKRLLDS